MLLLLQVYALFCSDVSHKFMIKYIPCEENAKTKKGFTWLAIVEREQMTLLNLNWDRQRRLFLFLDYFYFVFWLPCMQRCKMWKNPVSRGSKPASYRHKRCFHRNKYTPAGRWKDIVPRYARLLGWWHAWSRPGPNGDEVRRRNGEFISCHIQYSLLRYTCHSAMHGGEI